MPPESYNLLGSVIASILPENRMSKSGNLPNISGIITVVLFSADPSGIAFLVLPKYLNIGEMKSVPLSMYVRKTAALWL